MKDAIIDQNRGIFSRTRLGSRMFMATWSRSRMTEKTGAGAAPNHENIQY